MRSIIVLSHNQHSISLDQSSLTSAHNEENPLSHILYHISNLKFGPNSGFPHFLDWLFHSHLSHSILSPNAEAFASFQPSRETHHNYHDPLFLVHLLPELWLSLLQLQSMSLLASSSFGIPRIREAFTPLPFRKDSSSLIFIEAATSSGRPDLMIFWRNESERCGVLPNSYT